MNRCESFIGLLIFLQPGQGDQLIVPQLVFFTFPENLEYIIEPLHISRGPVLMQVGYLSRPCWASPSG
jgi:hypothetical protein